MILQVFHDMEILKLAHILHIVVYRNDCLGSVPQQVLWFMRM